MEIVSKGTCNLPLFIFDNRSSPSLFPIVYDKCIGLSLHLVAPGEYFLMRLWKTEYGLPESKCRFKVSKPGEMPYMYSIPIRIIWNIQYESLNKENSIHVYLNFARMFSKCTKVIY